MINNSNVNSKRCSIIKKLNVIGFKRLDTFNFKVCKSNYIKVLKINSNFTL